jgi:small-conductance mechanosensitive channel
LLHYLIITVALLAGFTSLGLDLGSLALIAGALSVGIGFGLQSIVNNFLSGLILLFEGSLRAGDYIELDSGVTGVVQEISTRYTRINTNDNVDVIVPNSELVSLKMTNWTLKEPVVRLRIPFGVAYGSDKEQVRKAALEAASDVHYTMKNALYGRKTEVVLSGFGESSLNFQLMVWVARHAVHRPFAVKGAYYWALETRLGEHGIQIPFPQRDVYLKQPREDQALASPEEEIK